MSGYEEPNYTQAPNAFFDVVMPQIDSITELKVTLAVIRQTYGWQKPGGDTISLSQLEKLTGLPRKSVVDGVSRALKRGSVVRKKVGNSYSYRLKVVTTGNQQSDEGSYQGLPKVVTTGNPQKKEKESYSRRDADASKPNYFKDFCDDMSKVGLTVDDDHRKTIPKNLTYLLEKKGATPSEMVQVIWKMVEARARTERPYELSPQKALDQIRGTNVHTFPVQPEPIHPTSQQALEARNKPNARWWYPIAYPDLDESEIDEVFENHQTHSEICETLDEMKRELWLREQCTTAN